MRRRCSPAALCLLLLGLSPHAQAQGDMARRWYMLPLRASDASDTAALLQQAFNAGAENSAPGNQSGLRIIPDSQDHDVLVYATGTEEAQIEAVLGQIDTSPAQVRIDAIIAEVDLSATLQYGTQFSLKSGGIKAVLSTSGSNALNTALSGFVLSGHGADAAPLAIAALQAVTKVRLLSSPELLVQDGQPASLHVGNLVPYLTQSISGTNNAGASAINRVAYQETGIVLNLIAHTGQDGLVTLDIAAQVTGVAATLSTPGLNSPSFTNRAVTSRIAVRDGETIALAGLISDDATQTNQGVPWFKNIPLLGFLFGGQTNNRPRQEILVLITPHVLRGQGKALNLTADLQEQLPQTNRAGAISP